MGQPTPPGDIPLYEGLPSEWNDIVSAFPEDQRATLAPKLKERLDRYEPLKQYEDFQKSGVTPDHLQTALNLFSVIENDPRQVYDAIGKHLGLTKQETKEAVQELNKQTSQSGEDPRLQTMQQQLDTLAQIALAQRQQTAEEQAIMQQEEALDRELAAVKKKYGESEVNEREIMMRMAHEGMTAEQAHLDFTNMVSELRKRRPAPTLMGGGGSVPRERLDPTKLDSAGTKNLVAQMMEQGINASRS